mmetsp:Transcript_30603/g.87837  ORF Transcript_30603/g.87837 Transcript_30603/m.87837 type:complete len:219 (-) Transcript_30603:884-1540(-)
MLGRATDHLGLAPQYVGYSGEAVGLSLPPRGPRLSLGSHSSRLSGVASPWTVIPSRRLRCRPWDVSSRQRRTRAGLPLRQASASGLSRRRLRLLSLPQHQELLPRPLVLGSSRLQAALTVATAVALQEQSGLLKWLAWTASPTTRNACAQGRLSAWSCPVCVGCHSRECKKVPMQMLSSRRCQSRALPSAHPARSSAAAVTSGVCRLSQFTDDETRTS